MIRAPNVLVVGGGGRGVGKTAFACAVIERFNARHDIVAVKITTFDPSDGSHRAATPALSSAAYTLTEEVDPHDTKDTSRMLAAGARRVLWLQSTDMHLEEGIASLLDRLGPGVVSVWESTRARQHVEPGAFIVIKGADAGDCQGSPGASTGVWGPKPWAEGLALEADRVAFSDGTTFDIDWDDIRFFGRRWAVRMDATAVLLAGGGSTRMGADKTLLPIGGKPMIRHIHDRLRPWFARIIVSSNDAAAHGFLGAPVIPDETPGQGPLMGIISALKAARDELCFIVACDIPEVDIDLVRAMVRQAGDCDAVVPHSGRPEPLCAVYRKSVLSVFEQMLSSGHYRMTEALGHCRVKYVPATPGQIGNLNTMSEYRRYIGKAEDANP